MVGRISIVRIAGLAQLVEQLICNQQVAGSSPIASSIFLIDVPRFEEVVQENLQEFARESLFVRRGTQVANGGRL